MTTRSDEVVSQLKAMITSGRYTPGQRLPTEDELTAELGVSRSVLRDAVRALTFARILRTRQGDGTYVTTLEPDLLFESIGSVIDVVDPATMLELYQVRRLLEPAAAALATPRISSEDIELLRDCIERMEAADDPDTFIQADLEFHERLVAAAGNQVLTAINRLLATHGARVRLRRAREEQKATGDAHHAHRAVVAALAEGDAELVRALVTSHIADGEQWLRAAPDAASPDLD